MLWPNRVTREAETASPRLFKVGTGKISYYLRDRTNRCGEMLANYIALTGHKHGTIYKEILHAIASGCRNGFDRIIRQLPTT